MHAIKANFIIYKEDESDISEFEHQRIMDRILEVIEQHGMVTFSRWEPVADDQEAMQETMNALGLEVKDE